MKILHGFLISITSSLYLIQPPSRYYTTRYFQGAIVSPNAKRSHWYSDPIAVIHPEFPKSPFNTVGWRKKAIE